MTRHSDDDESVSDVNPGTNNPDSEASRNESSADSVEPSNPAAGGPPQPGGGGIGQSPQAGEGNIPESDGTMAVFTLGVVLVLVLGMANVAFAADGTALDRDHVMDVFDDEGVHSEVTQELQEMTIQQILDSIDDDTWESMSESHQEEVERDVTETVEEHLDRTYVSRELQRNVHNLYDYIEGISDDLHLSTDLSEPREGILLDLPVFVDHESASENIPEERNITEGGVPPDRVDTVASGAGLVGTMSWLLPLLAIGLAGGVYYVTTSLYRTGNTVGAALVAAGVIGLLTGYVAGPFASDAVGDSMSADTSEVQAVVDGFVAVVDSMFATVVSQSVVLTVAGVGVMGLVWADREGHLAGVKESVGFGESRTQDDSEQGEDTQPQSTGGPPPGVTQPQSSSSQHQPPQTPQSQGPPPNDQHRQGPPPAGQQTHVTPTRDQPQARQLSTDHSSEQQDIQGPHHSRQPSENQHEHDNNSPKSQKSPPPQRPPPETDPAGENPDSVDQSLDGGRAGADEFDDIGYPVDDSGGEEGEESDEN